MIRLEDLAWPTRLLIGALAALAALILLMLAADSEPHTVPYSAYEERLIQLDREAIEHAYVEHVKKLFGLWVVDPAEQPQRAVRGARAARNAFDRAMAETDKREQELIKNR